MDPLDALALAQQEFRRRLVAVPDDAWGNPTPCEQWDVTTLVRHVIGGDRMAAAIVAGGSREDGTAAFRGVDLGDDPVAVFDEAATTLRAAFAADGALERVVAHPMTDMTGQALLGFRITDHVLHAWDLARAAGLDDRLDPGLVAVVWADVEPMAAGLAQTGLFGDGASGALPPDADQQTRLLDAVGRRP